MSVKKKRLLTVIGLVVLMAALGVAYYFIPKTEKEADSSEEQSQSEETETIDVETIDKNSVTELSMQTKENTVTLIKENDTWKFKDDKASAVNTELVDTMLNSISPVKALKELSMEGVQLSDYGLDNPELVISVKAADKTYRYSLGIEVPVVGGRYGINGDGTKLYALNTNLYSAFNQTKNALIKMETMPEITSDYITHLKVDNKKGDDFEMKEAAKSERVDSASKWNIVKPYKYPVAVNMNTITTLLDVYTTYSFTGCVGYDLKDDKKYGFDNPTSVITMKYYEVKDGVAATPTPAPESTSSVVQAGSGSETMIPEKDRKYHDLKVLIGKKVNDEYYIKAEGYHGVYTISAESVESYTGPDVYTYMDHCIYTKLATDLKGFDVYTNGKKISVKRSSTGKKEDGVEQNEWTLNGKKVDTKAEEDETKFLTPFSKAYLFELSGYIKDDVKPKSDKEVLKIVYHEKDKDVTVRYLPYDGSNFYRVDKNGEMLFLTDKRAVDDTAKAFEEMLDLINKK